MRGEPGGKPWEVHELLMVVGLALSGNFGSEKGKSERRKRIERKENEV